MIAFACAVGLLGACFGATSTWFQSALKRIASSAASFDVAAFLTSTITLFVEHGAIVKAIRAGDGRAAAQAARAHIEDLIHRYRKAGESG